MALGKKSLGQKRQERQAAIAKAPKAKAEKSDLEKLVSQINTRLGGQGFVHLGSQIHSKGWQRRSSGIPSIDYITSGGYPRGGLVEIGGEYSSFKTGAALEACAYEQKHENGRIAWVALEPFSKRWARERGFWLPFSEDLAPNAETGELEPIDPFANASALELHRMQQLGIEDPYEQRGEFVLIQEERGDVALDATLDLIKSNMFAIVVVDSLGVAKSTSWLEEKEVQDASDFPREAKMIGDYTARCVLSLNKRFDENNKEAKDGKYTNQTTVIHLNHIVTAIGTQARSKHKTQSIKGGEGNKHNHHCIIFFWKGEMHQEERPGQPAYRYAQDIKAMCLKSKLGPPMMEGSFTFYMQPHGRFETGDVDVISDLLNLAIMAGIVKRTGSWYEYDALKAQGRDGLAEMLIDSPEWTEHLSDAVKLALRR